MIPFLFIFLNNGLISFLISERTIFLKLFHFVFNLFLFCMNIKVGIKIVNQADLIWKEEGSNIENKLFIIFSLCFYLLLFLILNYCLLNFYY
jgi:hypothetical protein